MTRRALDIDGYPIRNVSDLLRWNAESEARLVHYRDRFQSMADDDKATAQEVAVAWGAYNKAYEERLRQHALMKRVFGQVRSLMREDETVGAMLARIGPAAEDALVRAVFGDDDE